VLRSYDPLARVEYQERSSAIRALDGTFRNARLADQCRLLVTSHAADRDFLAKHTRIRYPEIGRAVAYLGEAVQRYAEQLAQPLVPATLANIEQSRAAGIGGIRRMDPPTRESPDQERVDGTKGELSCLSGFASTSDLLEDPRELRRREVRIQPQPRLFNYFIFAPGILKLPARVRRTAVLPHDRVADGNTRAPVPQQGCFALVGEPDCRDVPVFGTHPPQYLARRRQRRGPDHFRIVLYPAGCRIDLLERMLVECNNGAPS